MKLPRILRFLQIGCCYADWILAACCLCGFLPAAVAQSSTTQPSSTRDAQAPRRVPISSGVAAGMVFERTVPVYPPIAKAARVQGTVVLQATISKTGTVEELHVVSGSPLLQQAAMDAVKTWRYQPYLLEGHPVTVETTINVLFSLGDEAPPSVPAAASPTAGLQNPEINSARVPAGANSGQSNANHSNADSRSAALPPDQQASREQLAKLFEIMRTRQMFQMMMGEVPAGIKQTVQITLQERTSQLTSGKQLNAQQLEAIGEVQNRYIVKALNSCPIDELFQDLVPVYQRRFNRSEVNTLIDFYSSPTGQHLLDAQSASVQANLKKMPKVIEERLKPTWDAMEKEVNSDEMLDKLKSLATVMEKPAQK